MTRHDSSELIKLSIVTPAHNEARNLSVFYRRLIAALAPGGCRWEWIVVDDHSTDDTFPILAQVAASDDRVQGIRLTRNFGSHAAIACGLGYASGQASVVLASDLEDPPELIPRLLREWQAGVPVVWAVRSRPTHASLLGRWGSRLYYRMLRTIGGLECVPPTGADVVLLDRKVVDALQRFGELHNDLFALIHWMGFRSTTIVYEKQARQHGRSGWRFTRKLELFVDAVTAFSDAPLRWIAWLGLLTACLGFAYAAAIVVNAWVGAPPQGWSSLMVVILLVSGVQMLLMGVLGQYVWRTLNEARRRPRFLVEQTTSSALPQAVSSREP